MTALLAEPGNPQTLYAGTLNGLYKSGDAGSTWVRLKVPVCGPVNLLAYASGEPPTLYAGGSDGLMRSQDGGSTWELLGEGLTSNIVLALAVDPNAPERVYVSAGGQVFGSEDAGLHWAAIGSDLPTPTYALLSDSQQPSRLYAGTGSGVFTSSDGGQTWQRLSLGWSAPQAVTKLWADRRGRVYAGTLQSWFRLDQATQAFALPSEGGEAAPSIAALVDGGQMLYAFSEEGAVYSSADDGATWILYGWLDHNRAIQPTVALAAVDGLLFAGSERGIYRSSDGGHTWSENRQGLDSADILLLYDVPGSVGVFYAATPEGLYYTASSGRTWLQVLAQPEAEIVALATDAQRPGALWVMLETGVLYHRSSVTASWTGTRLPLPEGSVVTGLAAIPFQGQGQQTILCAGTGSGIWYSLDAGQTWQMVSGLPKAAVGALWNSNAGTSLYCGIGSALYRLADPSAIASPSWQRLTQMPLHGRIIALQGYAQDGDVLWAITDEGLLYELREADGWQVRENPEVFAGAKALALADGTNAESRRPVVLTANAVVLGNSDRESWSSTSGPCGHPAVTALMGDDLTPHAIYLGTRAGLYVGQLAANNGQVRVLVWWPLLLFIPIAAGLALFLRRLIFRPLSVGRERVEQDWDAWSAEIESELLRQDRVSADALLGIPEAMRLVAMQRYVDAHRAQKLVFDSEQRIIEPAAYSELSRFAHVWGEMVASLDNLPRAESYAARLTEQLCNLLGFMPLESRSYRSFFGYLVRAPAVRLSIPAAFPIIFALKQAGDETDIRDVRDLMSVLNSTSFFALLIVVDANPSAERSPEIDRLARTGADDFIVMGYRDLRRLFLAVDPEHELVEIILGQVDLTVVSPYVTSGPVPENMFFGRDYELKAIMRTVRDRSHAIVGGRKIGKTSVLTKLHRLMSQTIGLNPLYLDCQHIADYQSFFDALSVKFQLQIDSATPEVLRRAILRLRRRSDARLMVLLLDEVDGLLAYDQQHQMSLFRIFRALSQEGLCRFVFCGERRLNATLHDAASPLFNFASVMRLSYLSERDALRMIVEPMVAMGIHFDDPEGLPKEIIALSSCHPNLVQAICQMLVVRVNERNDRVIRIGDIQDVRDSDDFHDLFLEVTWGNANPLERLISLLMVKATEFDLAEVRAALAAQGCGVSTADVEGALEGLELFSLLQRQAGRYRYAARSFPAMVSDAALREGLVETLRAQVMG